MGIYDRDYYREAPRRQSLSFSMLSVTTWLIIINIAVFILDSILQQHYASQSLLQQHGELYRHLPSQLRQALLQNSLQNTPKPMETWGSFSMTKAINELQVWRFITFQFLHANLTHLFSNMLSLFIFGPIVESFFGSRRYLIFYLLCGVAGAACYLLLLAVHILAGADVPLIGASAGIFGVLVAGAVLAPNAKILLLFPPIPIKLKYLALALVGWATYVALNNGSNAGGQAAHLGGAALGFLLIRYPQILAPFAARRKAEIRMGYHDWSKDMNR
jgi:membrane associated rhomboid family serine protease